MISSARQKHLFYSEVAKLLDAGFDIRRAAAVLMDTQLPSAQAALLMDLNRGLEAGQSITAAFSRNAKTISELERCIIGAGERGGKLAPAFQHLADYFGMLASAQREVLKGIAYPTIVLHLGIIIAIVPQAMLKGEASPGQILSSLIAALLLAYAAALGALLGIRALSKRATKNPGIDRMINRIPWVGKTRRSMAMARFCKVYHSCLLAGISMRETVKLASGAAQSGAILAAGTKLAAIAESGEALGPQFGRDDVFPHAFSRSYATGEAAGSLDKDLGSWSKVFQNDAESSMRTLAVVIPKVLYFVVLGFVVWKVIGFYGVYFSSLEQIGE